MCCALGVSSIATLLPPLRRGGGAAFATLFARSLPLARPYINQCKLSIEKVKTESISCYLILSVYIFLNAGIVDLFSVVLWYLRRIY